MTESKRRYLIVGPSWIGDMVMAQSLFIVLKQRYPGCDIDVVSPQWSLPILERMVEVRNGIALRVAHGELDLKTRYRLGRSLRSRAYTHAIVLPRSWKSALLPYIAGVPVRTGFKGEMRYLLLNDRRTLDKTVLTKTVQRYVALAYDESEVAVTAPEVAYPQLTLDKDNLDRLIQALGLNLDRPVIGFMPGAEYGPAKQWPIEYFARLAAILVKQGYQVWIFGSDKELQLGERILLDVHEDVYNLCGKTRIVDVIDLLACAEQVVTNDSGLMHVAAALDVRINVIYGSSTPDYTPPLSDSVNIFYERLSCSPCFQRTCKFGHFDCLRQIEPDTVRDRILSREG